MKSTILAALFVIASQLTGCSQPSKTNLVVSGKVSDLAMENGVSFNFATFKGSDKGDQPSVVVMGLDGKEKQAFSILTDKIVKLDGFKDLDGKQAAMGGLLILSPLQERLVGKQVDFTCSDIATNNGITGYWVTDIKFKPAAKSAPDSK